MLWHNYAEYYSFFFKYICCKPLGISKFKAFMSYIQTFHLSFETPTIYTISKINSLNISSIFDRQSINKDSARNTPYA